MNNRMKSQIKDLQEISFKMIAQIGLGFWMENKKNSWRKKSTFRTIATQFTEQFENLGFQRENMIQTKIVVSFSMVNPEIHCSLHASFL